jgi:hypothetical protein
MGGGALSRRKECFFFPVEQKNLPRKAFSRHHSRGTHPAALHISSGYVVLGLSGDKFSSVNSRMKEPKNERFKKIK